MITWGMLVLSYRTYLDLFNTTCLFVRPDSGDKMFSGTVISRFDCEWDIEYKDASKPIDPSTIIWISSAKEILREFRVWIVSGKIVTWSEYRNNKGIGCSELPTSVFDVAQRVATNAFQIDKAYVVDICIDGACKASIVEFNGFSHSDLYECDSIKLFNAVTNAYLGK